MRTLVLMTLAAIVAVSGVASTADAKSNRGGPVWRTNDRQAANADGRQGGSRDHDSRGKKDKKGDKVWRHRKGKHERPFFLFRGRGDCEYVRVRYADGSLSEKVWRVCN
jgi:hypothetical protein